MVRYDEGGSYTENSCLFNGFYLCLFYLFIFVRLDYHHSQSITQTQLLYITKLGLQCDAWDPSHEISLKDKRDACDPNHEISLKDKHDTWDPSHDILLKDKRDAWDPSH